MFWWAFLVGDTPELFVGMVIVIGSASPIRGDGVLAVVRVLTLEVLALVMSTF